MNDTQTGLTLICFMLIAVNAMAIYFIWLLSKLLKLSGELNLTSKHYITVLELAVSTKDSIIKNYEERLRELGDDIPTETEKPISETSII